MQLTGESNPMPPVSPRWKKSARNIIAGGMVLNPDFKEFIQSLNDNQVRYLVIGGYAVALHGHPRYTKDLDVWIEMTPENAAKMVQAYVHHHSIEPRGEFRFSTKILELAEGLQKNLLKDLFRPFLLTHPFKDQGIKRVFIGLDNA